MLGSARTKLPPLTLTSWVKGTSPFESQLVFQLQVDILQAKQQSNNNNTGSCGGQCSNNKEGEENMNIQGSNRVFLSNNRYHQGFMALIVLSRICVMSSAPWKKVCHNKRRGECARGQRWCIFSGGRVALIWAAGGIVKTSRISVNSAKRNGSYVGVPGDLCRRSLYSSTGWQPQASTAAASTQL